MVRQGWFGPLVGSCALVLGLFLPCVHTATHKGQVRHAPTGLAPRCQAGCLG